MSERTRASEDGSLEGGNTLQFMDPPQMPADVAEQLMRTLDVPKLERYVRTSESWLVRLVMLLPNLLPRLIPLFERSGQKGHARYVQSLAVRGLIEQRNGTWHMADPLQTQGRQGRAICTHGTGCEDMAPACREWFLGTSPSQSRP